MYCMYESLCFGKNGKLVFCYPVTSYPIRRENPANGLGLNTGDDQQQVRDIYMDMKFVG